MPSTRKALQQYLTFARSLGTSAARRSLRHSLRYAYWQRAYARADVQPAQPTYLGKLLRTTPRPAVYADGPVGVDLHCDGGVLRLEFPAEGVARVRVSHSAYFPPLYSYAVVGLEPDRPAGGMSPRGVAGPEGGQGSGIPAAEADELPPDSPPLPEGPLHIQGPGLSVEVAARACRLTFKDPAGYVLCADAEGAGWRGATLICVQALAPGQALYGLGEKAFGLNRRGLRLNMWNTDPRGGYEPGEEPIYQSTPFLLSLRAGVASGVFFDNTYRAEFDLGHTRGDRMLYSAVGGELCYYVIAGPGLPDVLRRFTALTGRMPLPPRWALGYHQSRWSYGSADEVKRVAAELRANNIPCDALHLDIDYMDGYRVFTWDRERFPAPGGLVAGLAAQGLRTVTIVDPGVKLDPDYSVCAEGLARDAFCKLPDGSPFVGPVWPGDCYFPDFTNADVRAWWGDLYRSLLDVGVAGLWNDMNEPAVFPGSTFPDAVQHRADNGPADHRALHNVYGQCMLRAAAEAMRRLAPDRRILLMTRSCYAGIQRYGMSWTGDNHSTWDSLRLSIPLVLNMGLSGQSFTGPDVAGFSGDTTGELLARWTALGAFMPFFRNHSAINTAPQEPYRFGEPYLSICRKYIELRYRLLPYTYTAFWQAAESGLPVARPLALAHPADRRLASLDDQFLYGDALMVAPVLEQGSEGRGVYLPAGQWYDFWDGCPWEGARDISARAPLAALPLFARAGSTVPMGPVMQYSDQSVPEYLELHVFPGAGESVLYEDDGATMAYQGGERRITRFRLTPDGGGWLLERAVEGSYDPGYRGYHVLLRGLGAGEQAPALQVLVDGSPVDPTPDPEWHALRVEAGLFATLAVRPA